MKIKYIFPLLLVLSTLACQVEPTIFEQINVETKLADAVIKGSVTSLTQFDGKLYACDGNIYSKDPAVERGWSKISGPGGIIYKIASGIASGENYLYALNSERKLYSTTDGSTWKPVNVPETISSIETIFDDGNTSNKNAYLKSSDGKFYNFADNLSQEAGTITSTVLLKNNSITYTESGGTVTDSLGGKVEGLGTIFSLTYSATDNAIYAGTVSGLKKLPVDTTGKLTGAKENPPGNHSATIKSYEAFAVMATGTDASNSALYTSTIAKRSVNSKINGLWGYYYNRRNTWNRE